MLSSSGEMNGLGRHCLFLLSLRLILALFLIGKGFCHGEVRNAVVIDIDGNSLDFPYIKTHSLNLLTDKAGCAFDIIKSGLQESVSTGI